MDSKEQIGLGILNKLHQRDNAIILQYAYGGSLSELEESTINKLKYTKSLPAVRYDDGGDTKLSWSDLSITEKAPWIRFLVSKGVTSSKGMEDVYNKYATGGLDDENPNWFGTKDTTGMVENLKLKFPVLNNIDWLVYSDPNFRASDYGYGDIEFMPKGSPSTSYWSKDSKEGDPPSYIVLNPDTNSNVTLYNPDRIDSRDVETAVALDAISHGLHDDPVYDAMHYNLAHEYPEEARWQSVAAYMKELKGEDIDNWSPWKVTQKFKELIQNDSEFYNRYYSPAIDGLIRGYIFNKEHPDANDLIYSRMNYWPYLVDNYKQNESPDANIFLEDIYKYITTGLRPSYVLPEAVVTPLKAEGGPLLDYISSRTSNLFGLGGITEDTYEYEPTPVAHDYDAGNRFALNLVNILRNRGMSVTDGLTMLGDTGFMENQYLDYLDKIGSNELTYDTSNPQNFYDFLYNIPLNVLDSRKTANDDDMEDAPPSHIPMENLKWFKNWYDNRQEQLLENIKANPFSVEDRFHNAITSDLDLLEEANTGISNRLQNVIEYTGINMSPLAQYHYITRPLRSDIRDLSPNTSIDTLRRYMSFIEKGHSHGRGSNIYYPYNEDREAVDTHEETHSVAPYGPAAKILQIEREMSNLEEYTPKGALISSTKLVPNYYVDGYTPVSELYYLDNPEEVYARLMHFRRDNNLDPKYKVTKLDLENWRKLGLLKGGKSGATDRLGNYSDDFLLRIFNEVAYNIPTYEKDNEYDLSLNLINDLIRQGYQIEYV